ncbi:MAG: hypothetical protein U0796_06465 [Gemmatales bacterium]
MRSIVMLTVVTLVAPVASQPPSDSPSAKAKKLGWTICQTILNGVGDEKTYQAKDYPGNAAWFKELRQATAGIDTTKPTSEWPVLDSDKLVTHNPRYWQAHFEIAPADPTLLILHAGLLQMSGAADRSNVMLVIASQSPGLPDNLRKIILAMVQANNAMVHDATRMTKEGYPLHDKGDFDGAVKHYDKVLKAYPRFGLVYYERAYSLRSKAWKAAGFDEKTAEKNQDKLPDNSPEVDAMYALARRHDPFQVKAYQGSDQKVIAGYMALAGKGDKAWVKLQEALNNRKAVASSALVDLADALQIGQAHDLALAARLVIVARRAGYAPEDYPFLEKSLKALAQGDPIDTTLKKLNGKEELHLRQLTTLEEKPAPKEEKYEPKVADTDHLVLLIPTTDIRTRIGPVEPFTDYLKLVFRKVDEVMLTVKESDVKAKGLAVVIGIKANKQVKIWCEAVDGDIPEALLRRLEKEVATVEACDLLKPPVAAMLNMKLWGRTPAQFDKVPKVWSDAARKHDVKIVIPPDDLFKVIWKDE